MPRRRDAALGGAAAIRTGRASSLPPVSPIRSPDPPRLGGNTILYPVYVFYPMVIAMDVGIPIRRKIDTLSWPPQRHQMPPFSYASDRGGSPSGKRMLRITTACPSIRPIAIKSSRVSHRYGPRRIHFTYPFFGFLTGGALCPMQP